jgi:parallel beta-helix repeat protein
MSMTTWDPAYGDINCRDVVYEDNLVERNHDSGIFHEISYNAVIRNNVVRYNGISLKKWVWGADILVAASQDVEVHDDAVAVSVGGCGIVLVDQSRRIKGGGKYKTRNNTVRNNEMFFEGVACAGGGASDVEPGNENFAIITDGNNLFDGNVYRVPRTSGPARFVWGLRLSTGTGFAETEWNRRVNW